MHINAITHIGKDFMNENWQFEKSWNFITKEASKPSAISILQVIPKKRLKIGTKIPRPASK